MCSSDLPPQNIPNVVYRFGRATETLGDTSGINDGLRCTRDGNDVLIRVSKSNSTLRIEGEKNAGINYFEIVDENNTNLFAITRDGMLTGPYAADLDTWVIDADYDIDNLQDADIQNVKDRKSTRLNSSHKPISYAVFCLKKKTQTHTHTH